ncbi:MAG: LCP family protein [Patescibacteria group bacterium]
MLFRKKPAIDQPITRIKPRRNKKLRAFFWGLTLIVVGIITWVGVTGIIAFNNIQAKNDGDGPDFFKYGGNIDPNSLTEGASRINTLLIGADNAAGLTDSIQIYSVDPINNTLAMLSVPRDLYVDNPLGGKSKINEIYNAGIKKCALSGNCDPDVDQGASALKKVLETILGIRVHYFARADFQGFKSVVDSIGGVSIYVEKALSDSNFPCENDASKPCGYFQPAGTFNMTGSQALKYARCRGGNCGSDFGRAARQQQVVEAIREKTLSLGIISNPKRVTDTISAIGNHLRTDLKITEMTKLFELVQNVDKTKTIAKVIDNGPSGPLMSSHNIYGQYILIPKAGENDWSKVHQFVLTAMPEPYLIKENAKIVVIDASGKKIGKDVTAALKAVGYNVIATETVATTTTETTIWGKDGNPYTNALLKKRLLATVITGEPTTAALEKDFVLVIGTNYVLK